MRVMRQAHRGMSQLSVTSLLGYTGWTVKRSVDPLGGPRRPQAMPDQAWRRWRYRSVRRSRRLAAPLYVAVTFDVGDDYRDADSRASSQCFLESLGRASDPLSDRPCTLPAQGSLAPPLARSLVALTPQHEFGVHGYRHEVWGGSRWWQSSLGLRALARGQYEDRLRAALAAFASVGLSQPRTFRVPYLSLARRQLRLVARSAFSSDSSAPAYYGFLPVPDRRAGLWEIPVTALPSPIWATQWPAVARFAQSTVGTLGNWSDEDTVAAIDEVVQLQDDAGCQVPHVVMLAHPWEFAEFSLRKDTVERQLPTMKQLHARMNVLEGNFAVKYVTMSELTRRLTG